MCLLGRTRTLVGSLLLKPSFSRVYGRHEWLTFTLFVGCYVLFDYAYFKIPVDLFSNVIYYHGVVTVCADVLNWLAPLEQHDKVRQ